MRISHGHANFGRSMSIEIEKQKLQKTKEYM